MTSKPEPRPRSIRHQVGILLMLLAPLLGVTGCSSVTKWNMMPAPTVHQYLGERVFDRMATDERSPDMKIFYATNRPGTGPADDRVYENGSIDRLNLGTATVHFGDQSMTWQGLLTLSTLRKGKIETPLHLDNATQSATVPGSGSAGFSQAVNRTLATKDHKQLTIYVHGAQSSFFKSCVQGAQFYHFMTREGVLLSFSWPSTGSFLAYKKDVEFADQSVERFADLIEFLAANTDAEKINILAYSAGAQVAAPGLALLRERHASLSDAALRRKLRIGVAYFAAPDVSLAKFTNTYLPAFYKLVDNTTVTFHRKDSVLKWAIMANKESRLGRPDGGELTEEEIAFLEKAAARERLDAIDMQYEPVKRPLDFKAHGHWYTNEWVSSDVIIQFLYHPRPDERGLKRKPDSEAWYIPVDYPDRLQELIEKAKA